MNLLIRDFPDALALELKREALEGGRTLRDVVIERCTGKNKSSENSGAVKSVLAAKDTRVNAKPKVSRKGVESVTPRTEEIVPAVKSKKSVEEMTDREIRIAVRNGEL